VSRLLTATRLEALVLRRHGFVYAAVVVVATWSVVLRLLPDKALDDAVPIAVWFDLAIVGFFFMAASVLLEKGQHTTSALVVTPLRFREYLGAKVIALGLLGLASSTVVVLSTHGTDVNFALLLPGVALNAVIVLLYSFFTVTPFTNISTWYMPSVFFLSCLDLAIIPHVGWSDHILLRALPSYGPLQLIAGAFGPIDGSSVVYAIGMSLGWAVVLAWLCKWFHQRFTLERMA